MTDWKKAAEKIVKEGEIPSDAKADLMNKSKQLLLFALGIIAALIGILFAIGLAIGLYNWATGHKPEAQAPAVQSSAPAVQAAASPSPVPSTMPVAPTCDTAKVDVASITHDGPYAQVRAKLIAAGWMPKGRSSPPVMADGSEDFATMPAWNAGFQEVESCSGTGMNPCTYRFSDKSGNKLKVVGLGEDPPTQQIDHATVTCAGSKSGSGQEFEPSKASAQTQSAPSAINRHQSLPRKSASSPVRIEVGMKYMEAWHDVYPHIIVTSNQDGIIVTDVKINRGNCRNFFDKRQGSLPSNLNFGSSYDTITDKGCNVIEVEVSTNFGTFSRNL